MGGFFFLASRVMHKLLFSLSDAAAPDPERLERMRKGAAGTCARAWPTATRKTR